MSFVIHPLRVLHTLTPGPPNTGPWDFNGHLDVVLQEGCVVIIDYAHTRVGNRSPDSGGALTV